MEENRFYVYAYLREDGTPYYIGKGTGKRAWSSTGKPCRPPSDKLRVVIVANHLTENDAFDIERWLIVGLGRKDAGTGCLRNLSDGGEGVSGRIMTSDHKLKISEASKTSQAAIEHRKRLTESQKGIPRSPEDIQKMSKSYYVTTPFGEILHVKNLSQFCRARQLNVGHMCDVASGGRNHHGGYTVERAL